MNRLISLLLLCLFNNVLSAQTLTLSEDWWQTNGDVNCIAVDSVNEIVYLGGAFDFIGKSEPNGSQVDALTGVPDFDFANPNEKVLAAIEDGNGGWFIGGDFTKVGDSIRNRVAHLNNLGQVTAFNPNVNGSVYTLALSGSTLFIGGDFTSVKGQGRSRLASMDVTTNTLNSLNVIMNGAVTSIFVYGTEIYFSGYFSSVGGQSRNKLAAVNSVSGVVNSWNPNPSAAGYPRLFGVVNTTILVGGTFTSIGGQSRNNLAAVDLSTGLATVWNPNVNGEVITVSVSGSLAYIGGVFTSVNGQSRDRMAAIDLTSGIPNSWNPQMDGMYIYSMAVSGTDVYVSGDFTAIGGQPIKNLAALEISTGLASAWRSNTEGIVRVLTLSGSKLYAGGEYKYIGGEFRNYLAAIDMNTGKATSWNPNAEDDVFALAHHGNVVYAGGIFNNIGGLPRNNIAAIDKTTGIATSWNPGANDEVDALLVSGNSLYVGGLFSVIGGQGRGKIAEITISTGAISPWTANANDYVWAIAKQNSTIYVGGRFSTIGGQVRNNIAAIDSATAVVNVWNPNANDEVYGLALNGNNIIVAGTFTTIGGQSRSKIAEIDRITGTVTNWNPNVVNAFGNGFVRINAVVPLGDQILIGGGFSHVNNQPNDCFAGVDAVSATPYPWNLNPFGMLTSMVVADAHLYIGGIFESVNGGARRGIARYHICYPSDSIVYDTVPCSYNWNGVDYTTSGTYTATFTNSLDCDSIVTLHLTILNSEGVSTISECDEYTLNGTTYTTSGTYYQTLTNMYGCDSLLTLNLTINATTFGTETVTECNEFIWPVNGQTYTATGTYLDTIPNVSGCDSIITLDLTIHNTTFGTETVIACDEFVWSVNGQTYTTTGTYLDTIPNVSGCDSIITLDLTIHITTFATETVTACDEFIWSVNGQTYTATGTYLDSIPNANGCDSIITLNLTINNTTFVNETVTECDEYTWPQNGQTYTVSGNYLDTIPNANGCDSVITLNLTIIPGLPFNVNTFSQPSDDVSCVGTLSISSSGNADFTEVIDGGASFTHSGYMLVEDLCPGVHNLFSTSSCNDTLTSIVIIPVDSNYIFNNPFIDSIAVDSLGATIEDCDIYYNGIDTAFIDSIFASGNTVTVIWNIVDSNGSNFDTSTYVLNNGNGVYYLQLSIFCPTKSLGEYFAVTEAIYFENGTISTADLAVLDDDLFEIFPNPTNDMVTVHFDIAKADLSVYDAQGKHILKQTIVSGDSVSLAALETGVYFFEFITEQGKTVKRVVKQ